VERFSDEDFSLLQRGDANTSGQDSLECPICLAAISAEEAQAQVSQDAPEIPIAGEEFLFAFAFTRDQVYFTNFRILVKDKQGIFGSSIAWKTIPYSAIKAFFVETAGAFDPDVKLGLWPSGWSCGELERDKMMPSPRYEISFKKDQVDLFALQRLLNAKIFNPPGGVVEEVEVPPRIRPGRKFRRWGCTPSM